MVPIDVAISSSQYLFFAPRIRKTGFDTKDEVNAKFKDAVAPVKKNSSIIYNLPTGLGGNNENMLLLEHITGLEIGKSISYFYYPLNSTYEPCFIGSFNNKQDLVLGDLLCDNKKNFIPIQSAEQFHVVHITSRFSNLCSILEVCKSVKDDKLKSDVAYKEFKNIFLDDIVCELYDLRSIGSSFDNIHTLMYFINGSTKSINGYIKRLTDKIRFILKKNSLKASKTKIILSWKIDQNDIRGDKLEMLNNITTKIKDYVIDVEAHMDPNFDLFHNEKTVIFVACSKYDYKTIVDKRKNSGIIIIKANPLYETLR